MNLNCSHNSRHEQITPPKSMVYGGQVSRLGVEYKCCATRLKTDNSQVSRMEEGNSLVADISSLVEDGQISIVDVEEVYMCVC